MDLKQLSKFEKLAQAKKREIEVLRAGIVNTPDYQSQRVKNSKKNTTGDQIIKRIENIEQLETELAQYMLITVNCPPVSMQSPTQLQV